MDGWMDGWTDGWTDGWMIMYEWIDELLDCMYVINRLDIHIQIHITKYNCTFVSKLQQEGLSHHEISERVKKKAMTESESIYGTLENAEE